MTSHSTQIKVKAVYKDKHGVIYKEVDLSPQPNTDDKLTISVLNKAGKLLKTKRLQFGSFVDNWNKYLYTCFSNSSSTFYKTNGVTTVTDPNYINVDSTFDETLGLVIGIDDGTILPFAASNYDLGNKIDHGTAASEMLYESSNVGVSTVNGSNYEIVLSRSFKNYSLATINVDEVGIIGSCNGGNLILFARDVANAVVDDNEILTAVYTFSIANSSGFVTNYIKALESVLKKSFAINLTSIAGANVAVADDDSLPNYFRTDAALTNDTYGVIVGSGTDALDVTDFAVSSKISHGLTDGKLAYGAVTFINPVSVGGTMSFGIKRTFTNNSDDLIVPNEAAVYGYGDGTNRVMIIRTLLDGTVMLNGSTLSLTYTIRSVN